MPFTRGSSLFFLFFFFNDTATTEIYTLSLHDALPISRRRGDPAARPDPRAAPSAPRGRLRGRARRARAGGRRPRARAARAQQWAAGRGPTRRGCERRRRLRDAARDAGRGSPATPGVARLRLRRLAAAGQPAPTRPHVHRPLSRVGAGCPAAASLRRRSRATPEIGRAHV